MPHKAAQCQAQGLATGQANMQSTLQPFRAPCLSCLMATVTTEEFIQTASKCAAQMAYIGKQEVRFSCPYP